jgi:sigma-B regulation protein RsbU (phosphoserine phosphatase)
MAMPSTYPGANKVPAGRRSVGTRINQFWQRTTDGLELNQLWNQFRIDTRTSYRLEKLSPARRVLLLLALLLLVLTPVLSWTTTTGIHRIHVDLQLWSGLLMCVLLMLKVADRVVMKRDLEIAREIQMWLLPVHPPPVPGVEIAFSTRPANTVTGDCYDVFPRPAPASADRSYLVAVADVAGKSIPAALLMATFQASLKTLSNTPSSWNLSVA